MVRFVSGLMLCGCALPAWATQPPATGEKPPSPQAVPIATGEKPPPAAGPVAEKPDQPDPPKFWFRMDLAPEIVSQDPFAADATTTDSTEVKLALGSNYTGRLLDLEAFGGPVATIDSDNDATANSKFAATLRIQTTEPILSGSQDEWWVRPLARYQINLRYTDFFEDRDGTEHIVDLGFIYQRKVPLGTFRLEAAPRWFESTQAGADYRSFRISSRLSGPIEADAVDFTISGELERRWYPDIDPAVGFQRRDWRFQGFAGLDFAPALNNFLDLQNARGERRDIVNDLIVGGRWIEINSNVDAEDRSTVKFLPALQIQVGFN